MTMALEMQTSKGHLLKSLAGQQIHIPDLHRLFQHWPHYVNPHVETLRVYVNERLDWYVRSPLLRP